MQPWLSRLSILRQRCWPLRSVYHLAVSLVILLLLAAAMMTTQATRNLLLWPWMPVSWRKVPTSNVLHIMNLRNDYDVGTCPNTCPGDRYQPKTRRGDLDGRHVQFMDKTVMTDSKEPVHKFWPTISREEKLSLLYTLDVLVEVLTSLDVDFFLVYGTLLGVVRHRGLVPWDDDVDIAVSGRHWRKVKDALCCVQGFTVITSDVMQWKFFADSSVVIWNEPNARFPFVDIFFYDEADDYVVSMSKWNREYLLYLKSDVFPLRTAELDGRHYPVPRHADKLIREFYNIDMCSSPSHLYRYIHYLDKGEIVTLPCKELQHLYTMYTSLFEGEKT